MYFRRVGREKNCGSLNGKGIECTNQCVVFAAFNIDLDQGGRGKLSGRDKPIERDDLDAEGAFRTVDQMTCEWTWHIELSRSLSFANGCLKDRAVREMVELQMPAQK